MGRDMGLELYAVLDDGEKSELVIGAEGTGAVVVDDVEGVLGVEDVANVEGDLLADFAAVEAELGTDVEAEVVFETEGPGLGPVVDGEDGGGGCDWVNWGVAAATGGCHTEVESCDEAFLGAKGLFDAAEGCDDVVVVELGVALDLVAAGVGALEEGGGDEEVVAFGEKLFEGKFNAIVAACATVCEAVADGDDVVGAFVEDGVGARVAAFDGDVVELLVVGFGLKTEGLADGPVIVGDEVAAAGKTEFFVGLDVGAVGELGLSKIDVEGLELAVVAVGNACGVAVGDLPLEADAGLDGLGAVECKVLVVDACVEGELFVEAPFPLGVGLEEEGVALGVGEGAEA